MPHQSPRNSVSETGLKNGLALARTAAACAGCVTECTELSCPVVEITAECTDKCVVIACDDPTHGEMSCHGSEGSAHCDLVCDDAANCTNCNGFDEFLQCCSDNHSYFSEPRNYSAQPPNPSFMWDPFDTLLCACNEQGQNNTDVLGRAIDSDSQSQSDVDAFLSSASGSPAFSAAIHPPHTQLQQPLFPQQDTPQAPLSIADSQSSLMACMWGSCQESFTSQSEIVGHVNLQHLRLPSPPLSLPLQINPPEPQPEEDPSFSCLWRDCNLYSSPDTVPRPSSDNHVNSPLNILASHLLQDHLGISTSNRPPPSEFNPPPENDLDDNSHLPRPPTLPHSAFPPPHHECSGMHKCHWWGCGQTFDSCDELTSHITTMHVGAGKAHYECYWEGCTRHGNNGFASKQKICRHLQSHTGHRPFQCKMCQQNFSEAATLQQHMRRHTQEKPYACDYPGCGKSFAITGALTIHKRTHNGDKPFKCTHCDRAFAESSNLSKHLRTHTGARPYLCAEPTCNKSFARPDQLSRHMGVHRKKTQEIS